MRVNPSITINHFTGINERADPIRVGGGKGKMPFVEAVNVDIDDSGMVTLKPGYVLSLPGNFRDLWSNGSVCLFNDRGTLKSLSLDLRSFTTIISGLDPTAPISYVPVNDDVYLTNNSIIGYVRDSVFNPLTLGDTRPAQTFKAVLPAGHLLEYFNARLYVARDNLIIFSDPATCQYYDKRHNFYWLDGRISMMKAVSDGIFMSDSKATYFVDASSVRTQVADYPANDNSVVAVDAENVGLDKLSGMVLIWSSPQGICLGAKGGQFINLTREKIQLYRSTENAALFRALPGKTQYLFVSEIQEADITAEPLTVSPSMDASL